MPPCDRLLQAVTMRATRGVKSFLLIGVASLLHAKAIGTPLSIEGLRTLGVLPTLAGSGSSASAGERTFLVVAHGRFNKILISALQGDMSKASDLQQGNTCINVLDFDADGRVLVRALNVREHLEPALAR